MVLQFSHELNLCIHIGFFNQIKFKLNYVNVFPEQMLVLCCCRFVVCFFIIPHRIAFELFWTLWRPRVFEPVLHYRYSLWIWMPTPLKKHQSARQSRKHTTSAKTNQTVTTELSHCLPLLMENYSCIKNQVEIVCLFIWPGIKNIQRVDKQFCFCVTPVFKIVNINIYFKIMIIFIIYKNCVCVCLCVF